MDFRLYASTELYALAKPFLEKEEYVFKKCITQDTKEYFVVLQKPQRDFNCNEMRPGICDKQFAKFRCNGLIPMLIYNLVDTKTEEKLNILQTVVLLCF